MFWHSANVAEGGWDHIPNICALDVGIGANGNVWFVTCTPDNDGPEGGFKVGKLIVAVTPTQAVFGVQEAVGPTHALRISVAPEGTPWIVNTLNDVWFRLSQDPAVAGWASAAASRPLTSPFPPISWRLLQGPGRMQVVFISGTISRRSRTWTK
jgi:hypothetical protein